MTKTYTTKYSIDECKRILRHKRTFTSHNFTAKDKNGKALHYISLEVFQDKSRSRTEDIQFEIEFSSISMYDCYVKLSEGEEETIVTMIKREHLSLVFMSIFFLIIILTAISALISTIIERTFQISDLGGALLAVGVSIFILWLGFSVRNNAIIIADSFIKQQLNAVPRAASHQKREEKT